MTKILDNFIAFITPKSLSTTAGLPISTSQKAIGRIFSSAYPKGTVVGIYCPALSAGMLLVGVESIMTDKSENVIVLRPYDVSGILLQRTHISLGEITGACPFACKYENPLFQKGTRG
ncbi:MAG TPA: hypothetical protein VEB86_03830 [Chryseosolibacter sp.]|nr:hypothetical protein [Chryseosolibacter sp.]